MKLKLHVHPHAQLMPLVFGDSNNKESKVWGLRNDERAYDLLDHLNVRPSVFYQTKIRNKA